MALLCLSSNPTDLPEAEFYFTDVSLLADSSSRRAMLYNAT